MCLGLWSLEHIDIFELGLQVAIICEANHITGTRWELVVASKSYNVCLHIC